MGCGSSDQSSNGQWRGQAEGERRGQAIEDRGEGSGVKSRGIGLWIGEMGFLPDLELKIKDPAVASVV